MLIELAQHVVADAKAREAEGDCPSPRRYSAEQVEAALVTVADALLAAEAKCDALREALAQVKSAITHEVNSLSIECTVWMPTGNETMVDFIDRALTQETNDG